MALRRDNEAVTQLARLVDLLGDGGVVALTGAGLSTDSGIPAYRGVDGVRRTQPMTLQEFRADQDGRRRYWARGFLGWPRFAAARPNDGHRALAALQRHGYVDEVITQNVDGLHAAAGSPSVIELHGSLHVVVCLDCAARFARDAVTGFICADNEHNPAWQAAVSAIRAGQDPLDALSLAGGRLAVRPDGDVDLDPATWSDFVPPRCPACGSELLKPDVTFFGESVPKERVERCFAAVEQAGSVLVVGSSLHVMSGLRFVRRAAALGIPVAAVNQGVMRQAELIDVRLDAPIAPTFAAVLEELHLTG